MVVRNAGILRTHNYWSLSAPGAGLISFGRYTTGIVESCPKVASGFERHATTLWVEITGRLNTPEAADPIFFPPSKVGRPAGFL